MKVSSSVSLLLAFPGWCRVDRPCFRSNRSVQRELEQVLHVVDRLESARWSKLLLQPNLRAGSPKTFEVCLRGIPTVDIPTPQQVQRVDELSVLCLVGTRVPGWRGIWTFSTVQAFTNFSTISSIQGG
jgi:hypothetical protein